MTQAGRAEHSFGIEVARLAGLPTAVIDNATVRSLPLAIIMRLSFLLQELLHNKFVTLKG